MIELRHINVIDITYCIDKSNQKVYLCFRKDLFDKNSEKFVVNHTARFKHRYEQNLSKGWMGIHFGSIAGKIYSYVIGEITDPYPDEFVKNYDTLKDMLQDKSVQFDYASYPKRFPL